MNTWATAACHWIEAHKTNIMMKIHLKQIVTQEEAYVFVFYEFILLEKSKIADELIISRNTGHLASVGLFSCSVYVSQLVQIIRCFLYFLPMQRTSLQDVV